jgi:pyruvate formate lyase activating enzyme
MNLNTLVSFRKTSLVDYPGKISAVIFFPFCNIRCPWCHNGAILKNNHAAAFIDAEYRGNNGSGKDRITSDGEEPEFIRLEEALGSIEKRRKVLGAVVLSGGEPTLYEALPELIVSIKKHDLCIKLDTNGTRPDVIKKLVAENLLDYIALDLKLDPMRYHELNTQTATISGIDEKLSESAKLIRESGVEHEMRSIVLPEGKFGKDDIKALAPLAGKSPWYFRAFRPGSCLDPAWNDYASGPSGHLEELVSYAKSLGQDARGGKE